VRTARAAAGSLGPLPRYSTLHRHRAVGGGVPQRVIQEWLVHSTGKMTERYTRPTRQGMQAPATRSNG